MSSFRCPRGPLRRSPMEITEDNMTKMVGTLPGPPDTPYCGGLYKVNITLPDDYPFAPPEVEVVSNIWHPKLG